MEAEIHSTVLWWAFGLALVLGVVANKTNFCTMGAVSDMVNMGDMARMRSWVWAMAVAIIGVSVLEYLGMVDMSLTTDNATSNPPYRTPALVWPRYILGGLIFGIGMTLGSGCGNKNLIRIGGGNLKSIFVVAMIGATAWAMIFTNFSYNAFLSWMTPISPDLSNSGISAQDAGSIIAGVTGMEDATALRLGLGVAVFAALGFWVFKSSEFRGNWELLIGGTVVGAVVVAAWWVTAGAMGQELLEEAEMADTRPFALGAQSFTFIAPAAHLGEYLRTGFSASMVTFGLVAASGVVAGSLLWSVVSRSFRIEWFVNVKDFINHMIGAAMMGIGGVLAMGCTVGQAISGASTLALGSFITFGSIVLGSTLTMKFIYYRMLYEDAGVYDVLITSLADVRLVPDSMRKLEAL
ncbi:MAG: YeeE/YedE family protein [Gammaproteobacteria bacterium]